MSNDVEKIPIDLKLGIVYNCGREEFSSFYLIISTFCGIISGN